MKHRNREISIFNMSALDLFASALGAFILIAVVLFPYFPNIGSSPEDIAALRAELQETQQQLQACQAELAQTQAELAQTQAELQRCNAELRKKFVLVLISWGSEDDVDLHVIDPAGNEFYYDEKSYLGTQAKLEEDNTRGPGNEIWLHPAAEPGEYKIFYKLYTKRSTGAVNVRGAILTPHGREAISSVSLTREGQKWMAATAVVNSDGEASLR